MSERESAERLMELSYVQFQEDCTLAMEEEAAEEAADCGLVLARAYLRDNHADSELPITEEWLRSVGFTWSDEGQFLWINNGLGNQPHFDLRIWPNGRWDIADSDGCVVLATGKTRGALRLLCRALGIELKTP